MSASPIATFKSFRSWTVQLTVTAVAVTLLAYEHYVGDIWDVLLVFAWAIVVWTLWLVIFGPREIIVYAREIHVHRRGHRSVYALADLMEVRSPMSGLQLLVFRDGSSLWWAPMGPEGAAASDHIAKVLQSPSHSAATFGPHDSRILLQDVRFDPACCVGCENPATRMASVEARRGYHALMASSFITREVPVPVCARCVFKWRVLSAVMFALPILTFILAIKVGSALRVGDMDEVAIAIWAAAALLPALVVANFGYRVVDYFGFGVAMGTLDATQARAPIYVRREAARQGLRGPA